MRTWEPIRGFEGYYWVSRGGRIKNRKGHVLISQSNGTGYLRVDLRAKGQREQRYVHRLVAEAFIPNPHNKSEVNHKNNNPACNRVSNLEWTTRSENELYKHRRDI